MLCIAVKQQRLWDEKNESFIYVDEELIMLEHSLASLSKWESLTKKPFLGKDAKTREETIEYIKCMTISPVSSPHVYLGLDSENFDAISDYIDDKMTATTFAEVAGSRGNGEYISAEIIYYWMVALQIPSEYQYWHLNRLIALVRTINIKNAPEKKMSRRESAERQRTLNAQRRAQQAARQ